LGHRPQRRCHDRSAGYIAFEQSFPLADGWLLAAGVQLWRRQPSALL
jgi:hypothetical protein